MRRRGLMGDGLHKIVLLRNFDAASGQTFTESTGFTAAAGRVLTLFLDFTFDGGSSSNLICAGLNPQIWTNNDGLRIYLCIDGDTGTTRFHFFEATNNVALGDPAGRNKMVCRVNYLSGSSAVLDVWRNGAQVISGYTAGSLFLGAVSISNAEGSSRFRGTYHEISILPGALRDEQLRALTIV